MFCKHCGNEINENAVICVNCGCPIKEMEKQKQYGLKVTILTLTCFGFFIAYPPFIALLWKIPMFLSLKNKFNNNENIGIGFKICYIIFVGFFSGLLLLFVRKSKYTK